MQVAGVGVQYPHLRLARLHDVRMAMPHMRHIVIGIDIAAAIGIPEVLHRTADNVQRIFVGNTQVPAEQRAALGKQCRQ